MTNGGDNVFVLLHWLPRIVWLLEPQHYGACDVPFLPTACVIVDTQWECACAVFQVVSLHFQGKPLSHCSILPHCPPTCRYSTCKSICITMVPMATTFAGQIRVIWSANGTHSKIASFLSNGRLEIRNSDLN